jgi:hypothetical protein
MSRRMPPMIEAPEMATKKNLLAKRWHEYGERFSVIVPEEQPYPTVWDHELTVTDEKGRLSPQRLKHWRYLFQTKELLRQRYGSHHILETPSLFFDCLVPRFQKRIYQVWALSFDGQPEAYPVKDTHEWYDGAIRLGIFEWQVGFSCCSFLCERHWCSLHRKHPKRLNPVDIYGLISEFEGMPLLKAKEAVGRWFGVQLGDLTAKGVRDTRKPRRKVPKKAIKDLLAKYRSMRRQHVEPFISELRTLLNGCPVVPWHGRMFDDEHAFFSDKLVANIYRIKGPAVKAYLWLLMHQEEKARNTRGPSMSVSDSELAAGLGVSRPNAWEYRKILSDLKLIETEEIKSGKVKEIRIKRTKYA